MNQPSEFNLDNIKSFSFPSFQDFRKRNSVTLKIGYYTAEIGIVSWGCGGNTKNTYCAEILCGTNCLERFACEYDYKKGAEDELQAWYDVVCIMLNEKFVQHIKETYLN